MPVVGSGRYYAHRTAGTPCSAGGQRPTIYLSLRIMTETARRISLCITLRAAGGPLSGPQMEALHIRHGEGRDGSPCQRTMTETAKRTSRYTIPVMGYGRYCARRMEGTRWWAWVEQLRIYRLTDDRRDLCFKEIKLHLMSRAVCCRGRHSIRCSREVRCAMPPRQ